MNHVANQWAAYAERGLPADAGLAQARSMKRAFFGGAMAYVKILSTAAKGPNLEEQAVKLMDEMTAEFDAFVCDVGEGRA